LKSEAPKALYSSHSFIVSALKMGPCERGRPAAVHAPASGRVSAASLRPYLIPACVRGYMLYRSLVLQGKG